MTLAVYSKARRIGRITLSGGKLTGTSRGLQDMADAAVRTAGGDAAKAYAALNGYCNGYLTVIVSPAEQDAAAAVNAALAAADWREELHPRGRGGKFAHKPGTAAPAAPAGQADDREISRALNKAWGDAADRDIVRELERANVTFGTGRRDLALAHLAEAAKIATERGHHTDAIRYMDLAGTITPPGTLQTLDDTLSAEAARWDDIGDGQTAGQVRTAMGFLRELSTGRDAHGHKITDPEPYYAEATRLLTAAADRKRAAGLDAAAMRLGILSGRVRFATITRVHPGGTKGEDYTGQFSDRILRYWRAEKNGAAQASLNKASADYEARNYVGAAHWLRNAAQVTPDEEHRVDYLMLAGQLDATRNAPVRQLAAKAGPMMAAMLGGGRETWNGRIDVFTQDAKPGIAGELDWDGKMSLEAGVARSINDAVDHPDQPVPDPDAFDVLLHELIHGVTGGKKRAPDADKQWAALSSRDQDLLSAFNDLDLESAAGGAYPIAHTIDEFTNTDVQAQVNALTARGLLRKADFSNVITDPATGQSHREHLWLLTAKARAILPAEPEQYSAHRAAYQDKTTAHIEEGFNELGTTWHMEDFTRRLGVGDRETRIVAAAGGQAADNPAWQQRKDALIGELQRARTALRKEAEGPHDKATWDAEIVRLTKAILWLDDDDTGPAADVAGELAHLGSPAAAKAADAIAAELDKLTSTPMARHATLAEYVRRLADPARIKALDSWGHYPGYTADALGWVQAAAKAEHKRNLDKPGTPGWRRVGELADEINTEGPAGKLPAMASQVIRAAGGDPEAYADWHRQNIQNRIRERWHQGPAKAWKAAMDEAR